MKKIIILITFIIMLSSCSTAKPFVRQDFALATVVKITLRDHGSEALLDQLFARLKEIEERMSFSHKDSDIYRLNHAAGEVVKVHADTYHVIEKAKEFFMASGGFFDPSLGSVVDLWKIGSEDANIPSQQEIEAALALVNGHAIELLGDNQVRIPAGMMLDLGAIAKGYAADQLKSLAQEAGVKSAIFDLGGNVLALGDKGGKDFRIGIQEPFSDVERGQPFGILNLSDRTVVTSGDYERFFEKDGVRYHHILDYRTGYPAVNELASVSIITQSSIKADAMSTAVYAMGLQRGLAFVEAQEDLEAIFVTKDKKIVLTKGIANHFTLENKNYHQE